MRSRNPQPHVPEGSDPSADPRCVVLLGASNLRQGMRTLLRALAAGLRGPLDVYGACGFGRSYGVSTWVPFRSLPGIVTCGLWDALSAGSAASSGKRPLALVTDVGNDLLYGVEPPLILEWIEQCVQRTAALGAQIVVTLPPAAGLERLPNWRYVATRRLFFPLSRLSRLEMCGSVRQIADGLQRLAAQYGAAVVAPEVDWYGIDPIHVRRSRRSASWLSVASAWPDFARESGEPHAEGVERAGTPGLFWWPRAERRTVLGIDVRSPQPCLRKPGLRVSLF